MQETCLTSQSLNNSNYLHTATHVHIYILLVQLLQTKPNSQAPMEDSKPLHISHVHTSSITINRFHISLHCLAVSFLAYYRATFFLQSDNKTRGLSVPTLPWLLLSVSELILFAIWLLDRAFRWRPVSRTAFPERLPEEDELPSVDVFVFTADPEREPTLQVMNTVLSAMAMDFPPDKLHVYLSDDGGSALTLNGMREARRFAVWWIPFCRRFGVQKRCPEAYFSPAAKSDDGNGEFGSSDEFLAEREKLKVCSVFFFFFNYSTEDFIVLIYGVLELNGRILLNFN